MKKSWVKKPRVALVYDRANTGFGGAERLLVAIAQEFAPVDLFVGVAKDQPWLKAFYQVKPSFVQKLPLAKTHHQWYEPLMPLGFESFDLTEYDVVISISSGQSKSVLTKPHQLHLNYLLTPPRYLYQYHQAYLAPNPTWSAKLTQVLSLPARKYLSWFDQASSLRPDVMVPLSQVVKRRAEKVYPKAKLTEPIYPFAVDLTPRLTQARQKYRSLDQLLAKLKFNLSVSRLVAYKRVDLSIQASLNLNQVLLVVGSGVQATRLARLAGSQGAIFHEQENPSQLASWLKTKLNQGKQIFFLGNVADEALALLYERAQVNLSLGVEDFGLVPLEAGYFGTPSVINASSGVAEVLKDQKEVIKLRQPDLQKVTKTLKTKPYLTLSPKAIRRQAARFTQKSYLQKLKKLVYDSWQLKVSYKV